MRFTRNDLMLVRSLERKPPRKKAKKSKQASTSGPNSALLRSDTKTMCAVRWVSESARPLIAQAPSTSPSGMEGPKVSVVLITEGLGNRRDMNYYGPEALDSAPAVFEGAHCFLNHPSYSEERDIPERRVQDVCGYFKNVHVEVIEGRRSVVGELHFDRSETGRMAYDKTCTALHYQTEFPGSDREYVGLSINANGQSDEKELNVDGETVMVNYVNQFTDAMSCDIVTLPARGGKFLALVESAAGADMKHKEVRTMLVKRLQAAQSALKEASKISDEAKRTAKMSEAQREIDELLKDVLESQARRKTESGKKEDESETESETEAEEESDMEAEGETPAPGHKIKKTVSTTVHHSSDGTDDDGDAEDEDESEDESESETYEANRLAVLHMIRESGLDAKDFDVKDLAKKGLKEAKKYIAQWKRMSESNYRRMLQVVAKVSPSHAAKLNESGKANEAESNNDAFSGCTL